MCSTCFFTLLFILLLVKIVSNLGNNSLVVIAFVDLPHFTLLSCALVVCKDCPPLAAFIVRAVNAQTPLGADVKNCILNFADCRNRFFQFSFHSAWCLWWAACEARLPVRLIITCSLSLRSCVWRSSWVRSPAVRSAHRTWQLSYLHAPIWVNNYQVRDVGNLPFVR